MNVRVCSVHVCFYVFLSYFWTSVCVSMILCVCVGEEVKVGDIPKPSLPSILPKKPLPPKTSSSPSSLPPRRPERPPTLASVHTHTHICSYEENPPHISERIKPNVVVWFTCSGVKAPSLRAGLRHQILPLTGHMTLVSLTDRSFNQWDHDMVAQRLSERSLSLSLCTHVEPADHHLCLCLWWVQMSTWMWWCRRQRNWVIQRRRGHESRTAGLARRSSHQWVCCCTRPVMKEFFPESCVPLPYYMLIHAGFKYSVKHLL